MFKPEIYRDACGALLKETDTLTVLQSIAQVALQLCDATWISIGVVDREAGALFTKTTAGRGNDANLTPDIGISDKQGEGITSFVAATGKPYLTGDVTKDKYYIPSLEDTLSELAVPVMHADGRVMGVLNIESNVRDAFDETTVQIAEFLSNLIALQLRLDNYAKRQKALVQVSASLPISSEEDELLSKVMEVAASVLRFEACSIFLYDELSGLYVLRETIGDLHPYLNIASYAPGDGLTGWVAQECKPIRITNPQGDNRWKGRYLELPADEIGAFLAVPILTRDRCVGVIRVLRHKSANPWINNAFSQDDEAVLFAIALQLGSALRGIRMVTKLLRTERMAAWGELSAKAAHVLGNNVFAMEGDINELKYLSEQPTCNQEDYKALAESLTKSINRLEETLAEFRNFVMATVLKKELINVNALLKETVEQTVPKSSGVKLRFALCNDLPFILGDPTKLRNSISEIIENAFHFQDKGTITVRSEYIESERVPDHLALARGRNYIKVEIEDQGQGVPHERKKQIFTPFSTTRIKGMGLGLAIVKGIVDAHEGIIYEDGVPGKGARFVIYLPVKHGKNGRDVVNGSSISS